MPSRERAIVIHRHRRAQDRNVSLHKKQKAHAYLQGGRLAEARALYAEFCRDHPRDAEAWFLLGAVNGQLRLFEEAADCCRRAIAIRPDHADAHFNLGLALRYLGRLEEAKTSLRAAVKLKPDFTPAMECFMDVARRTSGGGMLTVNIRGGVRICVPDSLQLLTPYALLEQEDWFEDEIGFVRRLLEPGAQVLDIGANYGVYSLTMAKCVGAAGKVWAFEPASTTASYLQKSIRDNGVDNVRLIQAALSNRRGTARLALNDNAELNALGAASGDAGGETVPLQTLDDAAQEYGWHDNEFIKLDAEGEERNIIEGGKRFLSAQSPLIMFEIKHDKTVNLPLIEQFQSLGYATYRLIPGLNLLAPFDPAERLDAYQLNMFCGKPERAQRLEARGLLATAGPSPTLECGTGMWKDRILNLPYSRGTRWASDAPGVFLSPGSDVYQNALNHHALAHAAVSPATRCAALMLSLAEVRAAVEARPSPARLQSLARIAWEAGYRATAIQALNRLANSAMDAGTASEEPFLPASSRFDAIDPGGNMDHWCQAAALVQVVRLQGFSSYFSGTGALKLLEAVRCGRFADAEMERRYQLIRLRHGLQENPVCHPLLMNESDANLNPGFWCGSQK